MILTELVRVIVPSIRTNEQGVHYIRKYLIYSTRKAFLEKAVVELVYKEKSLLLMFEKVSRLLQYDSIFFCPQTYMDTNTNHSTQLTLRLWGDNIDWRAWWHSLSESVVAIDWEKSHRLI